MDWCYGPTRSRGTRVTLKGHAGEIYFPDILLSMPKASWLSHGSLPQKPLAYWDSSQLGVPINRVDKHLPVIYGEPENGSFKQMNSDAPGQSRVYIPIDIFGSAFFMLTRYEEVVNPDPDEHDRFRACGSLAYQEGFLERPIIDEYVEVLWAAMKSLWPGLERKAFCYRLVMTHDVDRPFGVKGEPCFRVVRRFAGDLLRRKNLGMAARRAASVMLPGPAGERLDTNNTFEKIMDQSEHLGLQSEFYFMAGKTSDYDSGYDIFSRRLQRLLLRIHERGHVVGFHPSYGTLGRSDLLLTEAGNLRQAMERAGIRINLECGRQHFLRWKAQMTWDDWEAAGLKQDSSVGFAQHVGFRAGTCKCYQAWSWQRRRPLKLIERPLIAMDGSLFSKKYMGLSPGLALHELKMLADKIRPFGGDFVVLWHNDRLPDLEISYERILREIL